MSGMSRTKGKVGEREIARILCDLTGWDVCRRVRQRDGESDLEGVPGWTPEVKRHATATRGQLRQWWHQAVEQATLTGQIPVLFYRRNCDEWRAVWPAAVSLGVQSADMWSGYQWTCEGSVDAWVAVAREVAP